MESKKIGRYEIKGDLGEGGMATVYRAYDPRFEREVALKMLHDQSLKNKDTRTRFLREGRIIAKLDHPHIVPVYDIGEEANKPYLVMRYMSGGSLLDWIKSGAFSLTQATEVIKHISSALDEAHAQGIIHRDLKPGNILLDQRQDVFLSDFGIVKNLSADHKQTATNIMMGTLPYMSPEQLQSKPLDGRSDIYSLGVVLYEMLTGELPFKDKSALDLMMAHMERPVPFDSEKWASLPWMCQVVITKAMAKKPEDRYATAQEMYEELIKSALTREGAFPEDALRYRPLATADTRNDFLATENDVSRRQTTSEKIKVQLKRVPVWARVSIVVIGLGILFSILYQAMAAPNNLEPTATIAITEAITEFAETEPAPSETPALVTDEAVITAVSDNIIVRDWDSNAIWQAGDVVNRIPEDGEIPLDGLPILIQANTSPMELMLPDRTKLVLDNNTSIVFNAVEEGQETAVSLEQGRVGIEAVGFPVAISSPTGVQAHTNAGLMGVTYDPELETFDIDCLEGVCELDMPGDDNTLFLSGGEKRRAAQGYVLEPEAAQFEYFLQLFNRLPTTTPVPTLTATLVGTATPTATWTPQSPRSGDDPYAFVIGQSVTGKNLDMVQFGEGPRKFILIGGTHSGYAPNTVTLAEEFIDYYTDNPTAIPADTTLFIIPNFNPDAPFAPAELPGRLNANGVDLNRNWDCRWTENPIVLGNQESGAGGTAIESEPEVQALATFIRQQSPTAVIQLAAHGRGYGTASPGSCVESTRVSVSLSKLYGNAAGYLFPDADNDGLVEPDARLTGDMSNWLDSIDIPAISVLLSRYENTDFDLNLAGLTAVLESYTGPDTIAEFSPAVVAEEGCGETAVISDSVYESHQDNLGCTQSNVKQPDGAIQRFEKGTMIWRDDTDAVYLLYDDGSLDSYIVKEPVDYGEIDTLKGAFGYVWHTKPGVSGKIGEPEGTERAAGQFKVQDFDNGTILTYDENGYKVLLHKLSRWDSTS